jgi:hypothetical protein
LIQPDLAGIALGDGIGRQQGHHPAIPHQLPGPQEEIGAQIGAALFAIRNPLDQIIPIGRAQRAGDFLPADKRRIADDGVKTGVVAPEDFREFEFPVERLKRNIILFFYFGVLVQ